MDKYYIVHFLYYLLKTCTFFVSFNASDNVFFFYKLTFVLHLRLGTSCKCSSHWEKKGKRNYKSISLLLVVRVLCSRKQCNNLILLGHLTICVVFHNLSLNSNIKVRNVLIHKKLFVYIHYHILSKTSSRYFELVNIKEI